MASPALGIDVLQTYFDRARASRRQGQITGNIQTGTGASNLQGDAGEASGYFGQYFANKLESQKLSLLTRAEDRADIALKEDTKYKTEANRIQALNVENTGKYQAGMLGIQEQAEARLTDYANWEKPFKERQEQNLSDWRTKETASQDAYRAGSLQNQRDANETNAFWQAFGGISNILGIGATIWQGWSSTPKEIEIPKIDTSAYKFGMSSEASNIPNYQSIFADKSGLNPALTTDQFSLGSAIPPENPNLRIDTTPRETYTTTNYSNKTGPRRSDTDFLGANALDIWNLRR